MAHWVRRNVGPGGSKLEDVKRGTWITGSNELGMDL